MLSLDVRRDDSVAACVNGLLSRAGRVDVLVNNAGHELAGAVEELSLNEAQSQFEINFFGVVRMIKAVLPFMRQQRQGDKPRLRYVTGKQARSIARLRRFLPEGMYEQGVRGNFWLDKNP